MSLAEFGKAARDMSRNPLGIIALFITLIYGMASFVFVQPGLQSNEREPFIWFLICFPVVVLGVFAWLVARHHTKLYAPSDFRDESNFVSLQSPEARRERLAEEAGAGADLIAQPQEPPTAAAGQPGVSASEGPAELVVALAGNARARFFLAEELVLRKLELEWNRPIQRQAMVGSVPVDGLAVVGDEVRLVEVKAASTIAGALESAKRGADFAREALKRVRRERRRATFTVAVVVTGHVALPLARFAEATKKLEDMGYRKWVSFRFFRFEELAEEFGVR